MADPSLEEIATALYASMPEGFISSRNARAKEVGDSALAARVRALRKPSVAAWVVNVFAQERASQLEQALQLAAELREAQEDLDASALAKLGGERRVLTRRLAETAAELAGSRGERITPATLEAVTQSISAAFFDPTAAAAVASGRLVRAIETSGSAGDIREAVAGDVAALEPVSERSADELQARRLRREAERRVSAVEKELAAAERELMDQEKAVRALKDRAEELSEKKRASAAAQKDAAATEFADARDALAAPDRPSDRVKSISARGVR